MRSHQPCRFIVIKRLKPLSLLQSGIALLDSRGRDPDKGTEGRVLDPGQRYSRRAKTPSTAKPVLEIFRPPRVCVSLLLQQVKSIVGS